MKPAILIGLIMLGWSFQLESPAGKTDPVPMTTLRVGKIGPFTLDEKSPSWTIEVGQRKGFFRNQGLEIHMVLTSGFKSQIDGLMGGDFEIGHQSTSQIISEIERGAPLFMFMGDRRGPIFTLVAGPSIRTYRDLMGQPLGSSGTIGTDHLPLIRMLSAVGLKPQEYSVVSSGNVLSRYQLLQQGIIAGSLLSGELVEQAVRSGLTILGQADDYLGDFAFSAAAARRDWARAHPEQLGAYVRAYLRSVDWLMNPVNQSEALSIIRDSAQLDEPAAKEIYQAAVARLVPFGELKPEGIQNVVKTMQEAGLIEPGSRLAQRYVDLSFLPTAVKDSAEE